MQPQVPGQKICGFKSERRRAKGKSHAGVEFCIILTTFRTRMSRHERDELFGGNAEGRLGLGCVAAHGHFNFDAKTQS